MNGSHGRAARIARAWVGAALAAIGSSVVSGPSSALASRVESNTVVKTPAPSIKPTRPEAGTFGKAAEELAKDWKDLTSVKPPSSLAPTLAKAASSATKAQVPRPPSVADHGTSLPCGCPPPPPFSVPPAGTTTPPSTVPPPASQTLEPPAASTNPTTTPEPSTVVSALALIGAFAWRRRVARPRA